MVTFSFEAIGTTWWIEIFDEVEDKTLTVVSSHCERFANTFESDYSRFKADSILSTLNRERTIRNPSLEFQTLLSYGKNLYLRSNQAFNILSGHHLEARGYDASYSFTTKPNFKELPACNPLTDLEISSEAINVRCGNIDIGGYGKGYLIDRLVELLHFYGLKYFLINGGGDMYATSDHSEPIEIYLEHPTNQGEFLVKTTLKDEGFAASSPFKRQWQYENQIHTHLVSQSTLEPLASFVKAGTACAADAFATTALLISETECLQLSRLEALEISRFNPQTNGFWKTKGF